MLTIGFDCNSKSIAGVLLNSKCEFLNSIFVQSNAKTWDGRLTVLTLELEKYNAFLSKKSVVPIAYIETPIYMQNIKATNSIARVVGIVHSWLIRNNIYDFEVDVKSWKKAVLGNGNAKKEDIMKFAKSRWDDKILNQDIADAACIAMYGVLRGRENELKEKKNG